MKNKIIGIGICLLLLASASISVVSASEFDNWGMMRHDAGNTGCSTSVPPEYDTVQWISSTIYPNEDKILAVDNYIYTIARDVISGKNKIFRYQAYTGELDDEWSIGSSGGYILSYAIEDGNLYCVKAFDGVIANIYCYDIETLERIWFWSYGLSHADEISEITVFEGKILFTNGGTDTLYCLDAEGNGDGTTTLLWSSAEYDNLYSQFGQDKPAVSDGKIFILGKYNYYNSYLYCFNLESTGEEVEYEWRCIIPERDGKVSAKENKVFVYDDNIVYCVNAFSGTLIWNSHEENLRESFPTIADDMVFVCSVTTLYCYDVDSTGNDVLPLWTKEFNGGMTNLGPIYANGQVFILGKNMYGESYFTAIDAYNDHDILMEIFIDDGMESAPIIYDGFAYTTSHEYLYCIGGRNHKPMTPDQPLGPEEGIVDTEYSFILKNITDYEESDLEIIIDWGEGDYETIGPLPSGIEEIPVSHTWNNSGVYSIQVKTNDSEKESDWSEPLDIHIAYLDIGLSGGMGVTMQLQNYLNETKSGRYIDWTMDLVGGTFPGFHINKHLSGTEFMDAGSSTVINQPVFGLGKFDIEVSIKATGEPEITEEAEAFVLFFYVFIL